jgi:pimeloyl-ACP methyl ester carboxylesterase
MLGDLQAVGPVRYGDVTQDGSVAAMARRVLAEAPARFGLVGFSMGGYVAREVARQAPERVTALVLAATSCRADTVAQARRKAVAAARAAQGPFRGLSRTAIATALHPARAGDAGLIERIWAMGERLGRDVFIRQSRLERPADCDRLGAISAPTLVVAAAQDRLRSLAEAVELHDGIPGAALLVVEGSGHMLPLEAPGALAAHIVGWLRGG